MSASFSVKKKNLSSFSVESIQSLIQDTDELIYLPATTTTYTLPTNYENYKDGRKLTLQSLTTNIKIVDPFSSYVTFIGPKYNSYAKTFSYYTELGRYIILTEPENENNRILKTTLLTTDTTDQNEEGIAVSMTRDASVIAVGAKYYDVTPGDLQGRCIIYRYNNNTNSYSLEATLSSSDGAPISVEGSAVSLAGNGSIVAIGAPAYGYQFYHGRVIVWRSELSEGSYTWTQEASLLSSDASLTNQEGISVSVSYDGNTVAVGYIGGVYIWKYVNIGGGVYTWTQEANLISEDPSTAANNYEGRFISLSYDGALLGVCCPYFSNNKGKVIIWRYTSDNTWSLEGVLINSDGTINDSADSISIAEDNSMVVVGNIGYSANKGRVSIWEPTDLGSNNITWAVTASLTANDGGAGNLGWSVSLSGDKKTIVAGAPYYDNPTGTPTDNDQGRVIGWKKISLGAGTSTWVQAYNLMATDGTRYDNDGYSVAVSYDGNTLVSGAYHYDVINVIFNNKGRVLLYQDIFW